MAVPEGVRELLKQFAAAQARPITDTALVARMRSEATTWINAVHMQRRRARHPLVDSEAPGDEIWRQEIDLHFLLVALFRLRRAVGLAAQVEAVRDRLSPYLVAFDEQLPWLRRLRNVAEHVDDYTTGIGREASIHRYQLQVWSLGRDDDEGVVWRWLDTDVSIEAAHRAATDLYRRFLADVDDFFAATSQRLTK